MVFRTQFYIFDRYGYLEFFLDPEPDRYCYCCQHPPITLAQRLQIFLLNGAIDYCAGSRQHEIRFISRDAAEHYNFLNPDCVSPGRRNLETMEKIDYSKLEKRFNEKVLAYSSNISLTGDQQTLIATVVNTVDTISLR